MATERAALGKIIDVGALETNSAQVKTNGLVKGDPSRAPQVNER